MDNPALKSTLTRDEICEVLRSDLIAGKFHYDQPLRETTLAKRFGVSRGPIRDAFLKLSQEGSLVYEPNRGVRVHSAIADEERKVIIKMRLELEKFCLLQYINDSDQRDHEE